MADPKVHLQRVHFGLANPGAKLSFSIAPAPGFTVGAMLTRDLTPVASWAFEELANGETPEETLIPVGTYTLTLEVVFTSKKPATVDMTFTLNGKTRKRSMTGQLPDIGRALAIVFIE